MNVRKALLTVWLQGQMMSVFGLDRNISTVRMILMTLCTSIHGPQRIDPKP